MKSLLLAAVVLFGVPAYAADLNPAELQIVSNDPVIKALTEMGLRETDGCDTKASIERRSSIALITISCKSPDHHDDEGDSSVITVEAKVGSQLKINSVDVVRK